MQAIPMQPTPPKSVRMLTGFIAAVVVLSAMAMIALAIVVPPKPLWMVVAMELVIVASAVMTFPFFRGGYREAPALALAGLAGAVFMCSALGYFTTQGVLGHVSLKPWIAARFASAAVLGAGAGFIVLVRNPRSWGVLIKGALLAAPHALLAGIFVLSKAGVGPAKKIIALIVEPRQGVGDTIRITVIVLGGIALGILLCASVHFIIRAFEMCRGPEEQTALPGAAPASA